MSRIALDERYVRLCRLGGGGMGEVHLARDELLEREVALKVPRGPQARSAEFAERFRREARHVAALSHPNIVRVFDAGEAADGTPYMAMEYVPGGTLRARLLEDGPLDARTAASVALQICEALGAAHGAGVIHRDVKPENVLVSESGDVKVADFGIARAADATIMTHTSHVLGTVRYLSPEQAMGESVGPASDLYSLGVVLYEMLTGVVPFEAEGPLAVAMRHLTQDPRPLRALEPSVPLSLEATTLKLLEKRRENRYASAAELAGDLARFLAGERFFSTVPTTRVTPARRERRPAARGVRRRRSRGLVAALLAGSLGVLGVSTAAATGVAEPITGHPVVAGLVSPESGREPLGRALAPSTPAAGEELEVPGRAQGDVELREKSPPDERSPEVQNPPPAAQPQQAVRWRLAAPERQARPSPEVQRPAALAVPDLTGLAVEEARSVLGEAGLVLGITSYEPSASVPEGVVLSQSPGPGLAVEPGATVSVAVSSGPQKAPQPPAREAIAGPGEELAAEVIAGVEVEPVEPPEVEVPEIEVPDVEVPEVEVSGALVEEELASE